VFTDKEGTDPMTKTTVRRQQEAAERLLATYIDDHPNGTSRALHAVADAHRGAYYSSMHTIPVADVRFHTASLLVKGAGIHGDQIHQEEVVRLLPTSAELADAVLADGRFTAIVRDAVRRVLRNKLIEEYVGPDVTFEETEALVHSRLIADDPDQFDPCQGGDEMYERHQAVCMPYYQARRHSADIPDTSHLAAV